LPAWVMGAGGPFADTPQQSADAADKGLVRKSAWALEGRLERWDLAPHRRAGSGFEDHHIPIDYVAGKQAWAGLSADFTPRARSPAETKTESSRRKNWGLHHRRARRRMRIFSYRRKEDSRAFQNKNCSWTEETGSRYRQGSTRDKGITAWLIDRETVAYSKLKVV